MRKLLMLAATIATAASVGVAVATAADPASAACGNDAWRTLQTDHGATFGSEHACVKYLKSGGVLFNPQITVTRACPDGPFIALFGSGFHASSLLTLTLEGAIFPATGHNVKTSQLTDSRGTFAIQPVVSNFGPHVTIRIADAQGVSVTVPAGTDCPT
jgi:hypothetical protein